MAQHYVAVSCMEGELPDALKRDIMDFGYTFLSKSSSICRYFTNHSYDNGSSEQHYLFNYNGSNLKEDLVLVKMATFGTVVGFETRCRYNILEFICQLWDSAKRTQLQPPVPFEKLFPFPEWRDLIVPGQWNQYHTEIFSIMAQHHLIFLHKVQRNVPLGDDTDGGIRASAFMKDITTGYIGDLDAYLKTITKITV